jgi:hypothetical protein
MLAGGKEAFHKPFTAPNSKKSAQNIFLIRGASVRRFFIMRGAITSK